MKLYDAYSTFITNNLPYASNTITIICTLEAIQEIFHQILKEFRQRICDPSLRSSYSNEDDSKQHKERERRENEDIRQHAGFQLLVLLNERFLIEEMIPTNNNNNHNHSESSNAIISRGYDRIYISSLSVLADIKKLEKIFIVNKEHEGDEENRRIMNTIIDVIGNISGKIDSGLLLVRISSVIRLMTAYYFYYFIILLFSLSYFRL